MDIVSYTAKEIIGALDDINLDTLRLYMLHYIAEDLQTFGDVGYLDASSFQHFNLP